MRQHDSVLNVIHHKFFLVVLACVVAAGFSAQGWSQAVVNEGLETATIYVDAKKGSDSNPGTQAQPLLTIGAAVEAAKTNNRGGIGTRVFINAGTYREAVVVAHDGRSTNAPITFEATTTGTAIISGADLITGWTPTSGNGSIFQTAWPYNFGLCGLAADGAPFEQEIVLHQEMMIVNGTPMTQVLNQSTMLPGTFFVDEARNLAYIYPPSGVNLSTATVETATRPTLLHEVGQSYVVFRGLTFSYANTCHGDSAVKLDSNAVNVLFDKDSISWNNAMGISFATVNNFTVQNSIANHNGELGFHSHQAKNDLWQSNVSNYNNWRGAQGAFYSWDTGGAKYMWEHDTTYKNVSAFFNQANGSSWDTDQENVTAIGLVSGSNIGNGVQIEKSQGPFNLTNSTICYTNLLANPQKGGLVVRNSPQVTVTGSTLYGNGANQLAVVGQAGGIPTSNWETGQNYNVITKDLTSTGNTIYGSVPNTFSDSYLGGSDWTQFVTTLTSNGNKYYAGSDSGVQAFATPGSTVNFATWRSTTGQDATSTWGSAAAPTSCGTQAEGPDFWLTSGDYNGVTVDSTGQAVVHLTTFGLGGMTGTVQLTSDGVSSAPGVTGSFSQAAIPTNGASLFTVTAAAGAKPGTYPLTFLGNRGNVTRTVTVSLFVPDASVRLSTANVTFGNQKVATTSAVQTVKLTNIGKSNLSVSGISTRGNFAQTNNCGSSVGVGASCTISLTFTPRVVGAITGYLTVNDSDATRSQLITLTGSGVGAAKLNVSTKTLSFGPHKVGTSASKSITLKNTGSATLAVNALTIGGGNSGDFKKSSGCGSTIAVGASCSIQVTFTPAAKGSRQAALSIASNDGYNGSPQTVTLQGNGQ